jgi:hypothetical protein
MFLFTNVGLGVMPSPMSISSKGLDDEKPYPNFSTSSKSSMASHISFIVDDIAPCGVVTTRHFFTYLLKHYITEPSFGSRRYRHGHKSFHGNAKKVVACKIHSRQALGAPVLPVGHGIGYSNVSQGVRVYHLDLIIDPLD